MYKCLTNCSVSEHKLIVLLGEVSDVLCILGSARYELYKQYTIRTHACRLHLLVHSSVCLSVCLSVELVNRSFVHLFVSLFVVLLCECVLMYVCMPRQDAGQQATLAARSDSKGQGGVVGLIDGFR